MIRPLILLSLLLSSFHLVAQESQPIPKMTQAQMPAEFYKKQTQAWKVQMVRNKEEQKDTIPSTYVTIQDSISKKSIDPISGLLRNSFYAMNTKMIDSNYHRAAEYNKKNVKAVMFVEHPLEQISLE